MVLLSHSSWNLTPQADFVSVLSYTLKLSLVVNTQYYEIVYMIVQLSKDISLLGMELKEVEERIMEVNNLKDKLKKWYKAEFP